MSKLIKDIRQMSYFAENSDRNTHVFTIAKSDGRISVYVNGSYIEIHESVFDSFIGALKQFRKDCKMLEDG